MEATATAGSKTTPTEALRKRLVAALSVSLLAASFLLTAGVAYGQAHEVAGTVTDQEEETPLPGVNVVVKGTTIGTITSGDGTYTLDAPSPGDTLIFSFVGFVPQEVPIANRSTIDVALGEDVGRLDEVVVVGYGTQQKRDITGAVSRITAEDLNRVPVTTSFSQALQGQAAGVQVMSSGGETGSPTRVLIRGASSVSSGTEPLWIIDGMPVTADVTGVALSRGGAVNQDPLAAINPNDIESIEVLKDAAATAIYGSRGSNGVIIVTTKSGANQRRGETTVNVQRGFTNLARSPEDLGFVNTDQWLGLVNEARANRAAVEEGAEWQEPVDLAFVNERLEESLAAPLDRFYSTDWFDEALRPGGFTDVNFSSARGFDQADFFVSANYRSDEGVRLGDTFRRLSGRANVNFRPLSNLELSTRLTGTYTRNERAPNAGGPGGNDQVAYGGFGHIANVGLPIYPVEQGDEMWGTNTGYNIVASSDRTFLINDTEQYRIIGGVFATYTVPFLDGLSLRSEGSVDLLQTNDVSWASEIIRFGSDDAYAFNQQRTFRNLNYNLYGTYANLFGQHEVSFTLGTEAQQKRASGAYLEGVGLSGTGRQVGTPNTATRYNAFSLGGERYLLAYFSRANYTFRDRYLVGLSLRRDGSSVFTDDYRWGTFAAVSAGWIVSDEPFFNVPKVDFLKLRTSYGETGNQEVPNRITVDSYADWGRYAGSNPGDMPGNIGNAGVTWETTEAFDAGAEFELFEGRLYGEAGYYRQDVTDMLLRVPIPISSGVGAYWANIGDLRNEGFEFTLGAYPIRTPQFTWRTDLNLATNRNEVLALTEEQDRDGNGIGAGMTLTLTGGSLGAYYVAKYAGIHPEGGYEMIYAVDNERWQTDASGEPLLNEEGEQIRNPNFRDLLRDESGDLVEIPATRDNLRDHRLYREDQTGMPTWFGGWSNAFTYRDVELAAFFTFQGGNYIYDDYAYARSYVDGWNEMLFEDVVGNTWTPQNRDAEFPQLNWGRRYPLVDEAGNPVLDEAGNAVVERFDGGGTGRGLDRFLVRGDYLRLRTLRLGYTFRPGGQLRRVNVYVAGNNLFTLTAYDGWDPEVVNIDGQAQNRNLEQGYVGGAYLPQLRSITAGFSVTF